MSTMGKRLKAARLNCGYTQRELAARAGLSQQIVGAIEAERSKTPYTETIMALAKQLDISPAWIYFGDEGVDQLDESAIRLALSSMSLSKDQRDAIKAYVDMIGGESDGNVRNGKKL